jgi:methyl-accepting chemotaxis protein
MKWFYDLKIATKLIASFLTVLALTSVMGVFSIIQLGQVNQATTDIRDNWMPSMRAASAMRFFAANYRLKENRHLLADSSQEQTVLEQEASEAKKQLEVRMATYEKLIASPEERQLFDTFSNDWVAYLSTSKTLLTLSQQKLDAEAKALIKGESRRIFELVTSDLQKMVELNDTGAAAANDRGLALYENAKVSIIAVLIAALFIGLGLALFISRIISKPLKQAASVTAQLAEGNLNVHIDAGSKDETGMVLNAMQNMVGKLSHIIGEVRNAADNLASAS